MEFYALDPYYTRLDPVIDSFHSAIWTERYRKPGDVALVVPATSQNVSTLKENVMLELLGSTEIMTINTAYIEENKLKITGETLDKFMDERIIRLSGGHDIKSVMVTGKAGEIIFNLVNDMVGPNVNQVNEDHFGIDVWAQPIYGMEMDPADTSGPIVTIAVPFGSLYKAVEQIAETHELGFSIYLFQRFPGPITPEEPYLYELRFKAYRGVDRTSTQADVPVVRFSPKQETLTNVKELRSISGYKTVCYAFAPNHATAVGGNALPGLPGIAVAPGTALPADQAAENRRAMMIFVEDIITDPMPSTEELYAILNQRAADALANNNYTRVVDGEIIPQLEYQYGTHYNLGDIVELQGHSGLLQPARITEYIRSQDDTGERAYPTVTVLD